MSDTNLGDKDDVATSSSKKKKREKKKDGLGGNARIIIEALLIAVVIRTLFLQPFYIPSGSMKPNLLVGDYIVINKFSYGYSKYSCPFALCPIKGRIFGSDPERGDVVVFNNPGPSNHGRAFVKRLIGMPGDSLQVKNSVIYINGEALPQTDLPAFAEPLTDYKNEGAGRDGFGTGGFCQERDDEFCFNIQKLETLPNGVEHSILNYGDNGPVDNTDVYEIPEGHYMMIGDNRDNSGDSRMPRIVGMVPEENIIGKAQLIVFSSSGKSLFMFWKWRSDRFFKKVH